MNQKRIVFGIFAVLFLIGATFFISQFGAPAKNGAARQFAVPAGLSRSDIVQRLSAEGFVKHSWTVNVALWLRSPLGNIKSGGYTLLPNMSAWKVAGVLLGNPALVWVTIPEGLRKEETADILGQALGWSDAQKTAWINVDTTKNPDFIEGVYFPDTYLIPLDATGAEVAQRLIDKFNEKFAPDAAAFARENVKWTTAIKIASLVQRESAGENDMALIAGIIWNRLAANMSLGIDAALQYARGKTANGWWSPITVTDRKTDSPFNTYLHRGLPPRPIASPGLDAIDAVLHPAQTKCLYYLHDANRQIHCAEIYAEHQANIQKYLQN